MSPAEQAHRDRLTSIALMCGAVLLFAFSDASAKFLNSRMDTIQVVWARYMSAFVLALFMFNPIRRPHVMRTSRPWLLLGRSTLLLVSTAAVRDWSAGIVMAFQRICAPFSSTSDNRTTSSNG